MCKISIQLKQNGRSLRQKITTILYTDIHKDRQADSSIPLKTFGSINKEKLHQTVGGIQEMRTGGGWFHRWQSEFLLKD